MVSKQHFKFILALIQIRKREVRRTDASALGKHTFRLGVADNARELEGPTDDEQTLRRNKVSFASCARLRLHTDNPPRQILT